jgi:hypothetical protein
VIASSAAPCVNDCRPYRVPFAPNGDALMGGDIANNLHEG